MNMKAGMLLLIVFLLSLSFVSANTKTYDGVDTITIYNDTSDVIGVIKLLTPHVNYVPTGYQMVAQINLSDYSTIASSSLFNSMRFINTKDFNNEVSRSYDLILMNSTGNYELPASITSGNYTIGLFTIVEEDDRIDWIPTWYELELDEFAIWTAGLNATILSYYKLDETTGDIKDELNRNNGTYLSGTRGVEGKINNSYSFVPNQYSVLGENFTVRGNQNFTISLWLNINGSTGSTQFPYARTDSIGLARPWAFEINTSANGISLMVGNTSGFNTQTSSYNISNSAWHHVVGIYNGSTISIYTDNSLREVKTFLGTLAITGNWNTTIGRNDGLTGYNYNGSIDEIGIWNRSLNASEISQLWNQGSGLTYGDVLGVENITERYNNEAAEYGPQTFNISFQNLSRVTPKFTYNGTEYLNGFILTVSGTNYTYSKTINVSGVAASYTENKTFQWNFSTSHQQRVYKMLVYNASNYGAVPTLNLTCIDQSTSTPITCNIFSTQSLWYKFNYNNNSLTRSSVANFTGASSYVGYLFPPNITNNYTADISFLVTATDYPNKVLSYTNVTLYNNSYTNYTFYMLSLENGIYVTFQVVDAVSRIGIENAIFNATQSGALVCNGLTDSAGAITCFLDTTKTASITVLASGYPIYMANIQPSQSLYTISLGSSSLNYNQTVEGVKYYISPTGSLSNGTTYTFWFNITSSIYNLVGYGFNLTNGTTVYATRTGSTASGSNLSANLNTSTNTTIYMVYWWTFNSTNTGLYQWGIFYQYQGSYSIKTFFDDLQVWANRPEFGGHGSFTLMIIAFVLILISIGAFTFWSGGFNPVISSGIMAAETWLFYWVGMVPAVGVFHSLIPWIASFLFVAIAIMEMVR